MDHTGMLTCARVHMRACVCVWCSSHFPLPFPVVTHHTVPASLDLLAHALGGDAALWPLDGALKCQAASVFRDDVLERGGV